MSTDDPTANVSLWFQQKVVENYPLFFKISCHILRSPHDAEEVVQEATMKAWKRLGELQDPAALVGWIAKIARNLALDRRKRPRIIDQIGPEQDTCPHPHMMMDAIEQEDDRAAIIRELNELPESQAIVLTLRFFEDLDVDEIALRLGLTKNNVGVRLHRGLERLRRQPRLQEMLRTRP